MINQFMNWLIGLFRQLACWWTCHKVSTASTMTVRALIPALLLAPTDLSIVCAVRSAINSHITVVLFSALSSAHLKSWIKTVLQIKVMGIMHAVMKCIWGVVILFYTQKIELVSFCVLLWFSGWFKGSLPWCNHTGWLGVKHQVT